MSVRSQGSPVRLLVMPLRPLLLRLPGTLQKTEDEDRKAQATVAGPPICHSPPKTNTLMCH